jgi:transcriptional regulator with XRE-family HTH domain
MVLPDGAKIRAIRRERDWEVRELARRIRRSRQTIWSIERGEAAGKATMRRVARVFRVDLSDITLPDESATESDEDEARADDPDEVAA